MPQTRNTTAKAQSLVNEFKRTEDWRAFFNNIMYYASRYGWNGKRARKNFQTAVIEAFTEVLPHTFELPPAAEHALGSEIDTEVIEELIRDVLGDEEVASTTENVKIVWEDVLQNEFPDGVRSSVRALVERGSLSCQ